jgi:predicted MFS family arabinose efflux permease
MLQVLRIRDFRLLWAGSLVSSLGSWLLILAIPAHVFLVTGSLRDTGLTLAAQYLPLLLLGPVAGVCADRWDRRRLMIAINLFRAAAVAAMLLGTSPGRYWVLYAALVAESGGGALYAPAWQARTPAIVGTGSLLSGANSLNAVTDGAVRLVGGPVGGLLLTAYGVTWLICADALSYLVSAAAVFMTAKRAGGPTDRTATVSGVARDLGAGVRVLRDQPVARALLPVTVIFLAANASLSAVLIPFGVQRLGGSEHTGFLLSGLGVGFLLGAPVIRTLLDRVQPRSLLAASLAGAAAAYFLLFTSSSLAAALPAAVAVGMFGSMSEVIPQTAVQRVIPNAVLGRVSAVFLTGEAAATLVGAAAGPFVAQQAHLTGVAVTASLVTFGAAVLTCLTVPRMSAVIPGPPSAAGTEQSPASVREQRPQDEAPVRPEQPAYGPPIAPCGSGYVGRMARTRRPDSARVPIGLEVSEADAARIDQVLARPEFAGWSRAEWCREIIRTALRYYVGDTPDQPRAPVRPAVPQPTRPGPPPAPSASTPSATGSPAPAVATTGIPPAERHPEPAAPDPAARPECSHPPDARDYQTGTCAACGAILWD